MKKLFFILLFIFIAISCSTSTIVAYEGYTDFYLANGKTETYPTIYTETSVYTWYGALVDVKTDYTVYFNNGYDLTFYKNIPSKFYGNVNENYSTIKKNKTEYVEYSYKGKNYLIPLKGIENIRNNCTDDNGFVDEEEVNRLIVNYINKTYTPYN